jgi:hypothetical protein
LEGLTLLDRLANLGVAGITLAILLFVLGKWILPIVTSIIAVTAQATQAILMMQGLLVRVELILSKLEKEVDAAAARNGR